MKKKKGSYTLEAVIVMSTIIMILFAIVSAFLLIYQNAVMYYVATQAAQEGAVMWADPRHDLEGSTSGRSEQGNYFRIGELFAGSSPNDQAKEQTIQKWAQEKMTEMVPNTLIGSGEETIDVTFHNYIVRQEIEVTITKGVEIPFKEIAQYFGQDLDMEVTARAAVADPAEYIRNIDYCIELAQELWPQIKGNISGLLKSKK